jgi:tyrosyl-DNA phosphodiesterase-1
MQDYPRSKRIKPTNENKNSTPKARASEVFINQLDNYKDGHHSPHIQTISSLFRHFPVNGQPKEELQSGLILTFLFSQEILETYGAPGSKFLVVSDSQKESLSTTMESPHSHLRLIFPRRNFGMNVAASFHPKIFVFKFKTFLRVVIGSGNMLNCDWFRYANVFWRRDFPLLANPLPERAPLSPFAAYLTQFITKCMDPFGSEMDIFLGINFRHYRMEDLSVHLVASLPGLYAPSDSFRISLIQAAQIIKSHPPKTPFRLETTRIYYVTSSLGSLNFKLLFDFSKILFQESSFNWDYAVKNKQALLDMFNVIYPSRNYISGSYFGESRANCLFLRRMIYDSFKFQKSVMRAYEGNLKVRGNNSVLPHYKIFIVTHNGRIDDDTIVYIGSHNFTQSAWGKFEKKEERLEVCNYEMGLIFPSRKDSVVAKESLIDSFGVSLPPNKYTQHDAPFFVIED